MSLWSQKIGDMEFQLPIDNNCSIHDHRMLKSDTILTSNKVQVLNVKIFLRLWLGDQELAGDCTFSNY